MMPPDPYEAAGEIASRADDLAADGEVAAAIETYLSAWAAVPEPKFDWDGGIWIWTSAAHLQRSAGNDEAALEYLLLAEKCDPKLEHTDVVFDLGRLYFDLDRKDYAKKYLERAWKISDGRAFKGENPKYRLFIGK